MTVGGRHVSLALALAIVGALSTFALPVPAASAATVEPGADLIELYGGDPDAEARLVLAET